MILIQIYSHKERTPLLFLICMIVLFMAINNSNQLSLRFFFFNRMLARELTQQHPICMLPTRRLSMFPYTGLFSLHSDNIIRSVIIFSSVS